MPARIALVAILTIAACSITETSWVRSGKSVGRPGLGTSWGETQWAPIREVPFERESDTPFAQRSIFYDDREGVLAMAGTEGRPEDLSDPRLETLVVDERGTPLPAMRSAGRTLVVGAPGQQYRLLVRNRTSQRVEVVASVDGLDVVDGRPASLSKRGYLVEPYSSVSIDGFRRDLRRVAAFHFGAVADSYAARTSGDENVGVIGFAFFAERGAHASPDDRYEAARRLDAEPFPDLRFAQPPMP